VIWFLINYMHIIFAMIANFRIIALDMGLPVLPLAVIAPIDRAFYFGKVNIISEKLCFKCGEVKPLEKFGKDHYNTCKDCLAAKARQYRRFRAANPDFVVACNDTEKKCTICGIAKPIGEFCNDKTRKSGKRESCKSCQKKTKDIYYINNKDKIKEGQRRWKKENPEKHHSHRKEYFKEHKDIVYAGNKRWREGERGKAYYKEYALNWDNNNRDKRNKASRERRKKNPERYGKIAKKWRLNNPERAKEVSRISSAKRRNTLFGTLNDRMSAGIRQSLKNGKCGAKWEGLVGYNVRQLKAHLEKLFVLGMNWNNMGEWHIDHKKPKISFGYTSSDSPEFKQCWALENLQPLWKKDNLKKGKKVIDEK